VIAAAREAAHTPIKEAAIMHRASYFGASKSSRNRQFRTRGLT
jgi:hypothetical protein